MDSLSPRMDGLPIHQVPLALVLLMVAAVTYRFFFAGESNPSLEHIPLLWKEKGGLQTLKTEFSTKALDMLSEGWSQFKQAPFRVITAEGPRIVLGFEHADELKRLPDTVVDNVEPIKEVRGASYAPVLHRLTGLRRRCRSSTHYSRIQRTRSPFARSSSISRRS